MSYRKEHFGLMLECNSGSYVLMKTTIPDKEKHLFSSTHCFPDIIFTRKTSQRGKLAMSHHAPALCPADLCGYAPSPITMTHPYLPVTSRA
jgi:hypothetical protein